MFVSQNNNRLFLAIVVGMFLASGCSGSVKYGANSEGEGMASEEEMSASVDGVPFGTTGNVDGTTEHGGTVDGNNAFLSGDQGMSPDSQNAGEMKSDTAVMDDASSVPGSDSADASNSDPEALANEYLQEKQNSSEFYGDPSKAGSSMETNPETWAQDFVKENGGPSPEHVNPGVSIAQANEHESHRSMGARESTSEPLAISNTSGNFEGRVQDIYFDFDSWSISAEGARYLEEDAQWLHANPEKALTIEGHCDQRGTQDYNLVLGKKRAEAAQEYLVNLGIQAHRINIVSYGKERPFCQNNHEDCYQENRRNHMVVRMNQS